MPFFSYLNDSAGVQTVMRRERDRYGPLSKSVQNIMRRPSELTIAERELIGAYVSGLNQCQFCHQSHMVFAQGHGVDPNVFTPLLEDIESAPVDTKLKPILAYVKTLTLTPSHLTQADYQKVMDAGWSEQALSDAIAVAALFNFFNRIVEGHGVTAPSPESLSKNADVMVHGGYSPRAILGYVLKRKVKRMLARS